MTYTTEALKYLTILQLVQKHVEYKEPEGIHNTHNPNMLNSYLWPAQVGYSSRRGLCHYP